MHSGPRYLLVVLAVVVSGHYILSLTHDAYARHVPLAPRLAPRHRRAPGVLLRPRPRQPAPRQRDPYTLLNDEPFTGELKRRVSTVASGPVAYGLLRYSPTGSTRSALPVLAACADSPHPHTDCIKLHPEHIARDNALGFISNDGGETYWESACAQTRIRRTPPHAALGLGPALEAPTRGATRTACSPSVSRSRVPRSLVRDLPVLLLMSDDGGDVSLHVYVSDATHRMPRAQGGPRMRGARLAARGGHVQTPSGPDPDARSRSRSTELAARPRRCEDAARVRDKTCAPRAPRALEVPSSGG
ncbi:hypothetical protein B0H17DRAFT_1334024 [Mycena rosella]|uniref:Uncharacterized protein n=1 Tax=Mycena rosella TaxID=1033263 RepID=A0AAD7D4S2_MYCRO|nr:hypothetical protein B0H17DRAFT_1334024 [Mycena rosella]